MSKDIQEKLKKFSISRDPVIISDGFNTHNGVICGDYSNTPRWGYYPTMYNISTSNGTHKFFSSGVIDIKNNNITVNEVV